MLPQLFSVTINATGVAQQLPDVPFYNKYIGVTLYCTGYTAFPPGGIMVGNTPETATNGGVTLGSSGLGIPTSITIPLDNANQLWISGTQGGVLYIAGA
jgi:hypothetical protein